MSKVDDIRKAWGRLTHPHAPEPPLDRAALLIAAEENPALDLQRPLAQLDTIADTLRERIGDELDPYLIVGALNRHLFEELGFRGNTAHYNDPANSFLDQVLDRKLGIPISLGIVYMEVARRLGLPVGGLNVPGHFLVAYLCEDGPIVIDCFNRGDVVLRSQFQQFLDRMFDGRIRFRNTMLDPASNRSILARLLKNLKIIYVQRSDLRRALAVSDRLLLLNPTAGWEYRDRGLLHFQLSQFSDADPDLERYLHLVPNAPDEVQVRLVRREIRRRLRKTGRKRG